KRRTMALFPIRKATVSRMTITHQALMRWVRFTSVGLGSAPARQDRMPAIVEAIARTAKGARSTGRLKPAILSLPARVDRQQRIAGTVEESVALLALVRCDGSTEDDAAQQRHRQQRAFRQHPRHVLDPAWDQLDL